MVSSTPAFATAERSVPARLARSPAARSIALVVLGSAVALSVVLLVALPDRLAPLDPAEQLIGARLRPPLAAAGSTRFLLGSDHLGRDVLSRLVYGARISLVMGLTAVAISVVLGVTSGLLAGY